MIGPADINGTSQPAAASSEQVGTAEIEKPAEPAPEPVAAPAPAPAPTAEEDTEMKDAEESVAQPDAVIPSTTDAANGTPASKSKRKSSIGIPEHRSKSLKKKQSKAKITHLDAKPGDFFLARLRSYPPWPSIICDEEMLPEVLLTTRPVTAMQADGMYKEPYVDGGKKVGDRTYPVMFLHTNEL